jgi:hypothetical protein
VSRAGFIRAQTVEWVTPRPILDALGPFDLDPCSPPLERRPWPTAALHYSLPQDGLALPWRGRCWVNPPYGKELGVWVERLAIHGNGIGLFFARTETSCFQDWVWPIATGMLFLNGRVDFIRADGSTGPSDGGAPSVLVAYDRLSRYNAERLAASGIEGAYFDARKNVVMVPMAKQATWRDIVRGALQDLGGAAPLQELYRAVQRRVVTANRNLKPKIRQVLYLGEGTVFRRQADVWRAA